MISKRVHGFITSDMDIGDDDEFSGDGDVGGIDEEGRDAGGVDEEGGNAGRMNEEEDISEVEEEYEESEDGKMALSNTSYDAYLTDRR